MSAEARRRRSKTFALRVAQPEALRPKSTRSRPRPVRPAARPVVDPGELRPAGQGRQLEPEVRRRLEDALHRRLSHVRVHAEPSDRERARTLGARAFAHRHHIWLGPHESPSDLGLIAHEVAHVAQQGFAPPQHAARVAASPVAARTAGVHTPRGVGGAAPAARAAAPAVPAVQRFELDLFGRARRAASAVGSGIRSAGSAVVSGARAVGSAIVETGEELLAMGRDALLAVVRRVAPDFLPLFEGDGIAGFIRRLIERGLRSMFEGLLAPLRGIFNFEAIGARVSQAVTWISTIAGQLARNDCSGILAAARQVSAFFSNALKPVFDRLRDISDKITGFFRGIWEAIGAPIMDVLRNIGGRIWESLRGFVRDVGAVIRRAREALGAAWTRVKGWFGIRAEDGGEEGGGVWNWIREKASAIGESISSVVRPVLGPLRDTAGVLLLFVPGLQGVGILLLWPRLKQAWNWLSQKWTDLNLIPRARHFLANTVLPALMNAAEAVGQALIRGADWLLGLIERVGGTLARALRAATGILSPLGRLIGYAHQQFQRIVNWARGGLRWASRNMRMLLQRLVRFLGVVYDGLLQLIAIVVNPFGIVGFLAGRLWLLIPDCLKGPIIDFILEIIIRFLRAMPTINPFLGPLWPLIKSAALGFLERVLSFTTARKVNVSKKMALIISGQSVTFALGYLKGLALGVWEGITAPFVAIATIFDLPEMLMNFLNNLGIRLCELVESIRCFAANLAGRVFGGLDDILRGLGELLENPSRIVELIQCAIEGVLAGARSLGGTIANEMMRIFEGPDDAIGEMLGRITGSVLVQAVITYFTAGAGAAVGIIRQISSALGAVGRALGTVVRMLVRLFGRLVRFLRGLAARFARAAASAARGVLSRLGGFFRRVAGWFGRLIRRIFRGLRRRFMLTAAERADWIAFRARVRTTTAAHAGGVDRRTLRRAYQSALRSHRRSAKWPAFITKHGPNWRLWVRKVKSLRPRIVGRVLLDRATRWRQGKKAVKRVIKRLKHAPGNIDSAMLNAAFTRVRIQYRFRELVARFNPQLNKFMIDAAMSPGLPLTSTPPKRPIRNVVRSLGAHSHGRVDPLVKRSLLRSAPFGAPAHWAAVERINTRSGRSSLYIRGHIISGYFAGGEPSNLTPITRSANAQMATHETRVRRTLPRLARPSSSKPIWKYEVRMTGAAGGVPHKRRFRENNRIVCETVPEEQLLHKTITITMEKFKYRESTHQWDDPIAVPGARPITNVAPFPRGHREPCR